jgi:hypothetical protein
MVIIGKHGRNPKSETLHHAIKVEKKTDTKRENRM